jgi:hypothetical protein
MFQPGGPLNQQPPLLGCARPPVRFEIASTRIGGLVVPM